MVEVLTFKIIGIVVVIIIAYFLAKIYLDYDFIEVIWESMTELEIDWVVLGLTLLFSAFWIYIMWGTSLWQNSTYFTTGKKLILSIAIPIVGYPIAYRAWNKE